ncbi:gap junction delta-2 protein-like [Ammospiza maritima maritima]
MGEWTILERLLEAAVQQHSTMIGRILLTVVVIFRILIVAIVGETVYEDEQTMFMCNTLQPGCNQACYDKAFPISHIRYWVFQIILVCTPSLCFITYSVHQAAKQRERRCSFLQPLLEPRRPRPNGGLGAEGVPKEEPPELGAAAPRAAARGAKGKRQEGISRFYVIQEEVGMAPVRAPARGAKGKRQEGISRFYVIQVGEVGENGAAARSAKGKRQEGISRFYIVQVVFRNALEIGFLGGQYFLYGFNVPAIFECDRYPCVKEVECYVSRPTEKSVFLVFMFAVSGVCVLLNLAELNHLGWRKVRAAVRGARARRKSLGDARRRETAAAGTGTAGTGTVPALGRTQSSESAYV